MSRSERVYCAVCREFTGWHLIGQEGQGDTRTLYWRCLRCAHPRMALADVTDADQLVATVRAEWERRHGSGFADYDADDFRDQLRLELWHAYVDWDGRGTFLGFASFRLRGRAVSYFRKRLGKTGHTKAHVGAASIDALAAGAADRLDAALGLRAVDGGEDRASPLARELTRRRRQIARQDEIMGVETDEGAAGRRRAADG